MLIFLFSGWCECFKDIKALVKPQMSVAQVYNKTLDQKSTEKSIGTDVQLWRPCWDRPLRFRLFYQF